MVGLSLLASVVHASEAVKTIRAELSGAEAESFQIENLAGTMWISEGTGDAVTVVATVHAENQSLADAVRIERVGNGGGATTLRVRYPYDKASTFRYEAPGHGGDWSLFDFGSWNSVDYDGHRVRVSHNRGTTLYADLEIKVPKGRQLASFRNLVGRVEADGLQSNLHFSVESADLRLRKLEGEIVLEGSSGDIRASDIRGSWKSEFSSGDCRLDGFDGDLLSFQAESGDLVARDVKARRVLTETSSGDVSISFADVEEFSAEASSGDVALRLDGSRLKAVDVTTSSGDVSLRLPSDESFDARADLSSGDVNMGFADVTEIRHGRRALDYQRGTGGASIHVKTSSGDL
ncbi:MAG TPA: DUF4097 family beta strand repeat-containing protein, partial [Thermoanaerobaculia bacterium]|nr:DUF4097 family beta strand repeat-containing protein [Thermoanaerobaculia bacterium]